MLQAWAIYRRCCRRGLAALQLQRVWRRLGCCSWCMPARPASTWAHTGSRLHHSVASSTTAAAHGPTQAVGPITAWPAAGCHACRARCGDGASAEPSTIVPTTWRLHCCRITVALASQRSSSRGSSSSSSSRGRRVAPQPLGSPGQRCHAAVPCSAADAGGSCASQGATPERLDVLHTGAKQVEAQQGAAAAAACGSMQQVGVQQAGVQRCTTTAQPWRTCRHHSPAAT
jgi:hypothetical protein